MSEKTDQVEYVYFEKPIKDFGSFSREMLIPVIKKTSRTVHFEINGKKHTLPLKTRGLKIGNKASAKKHIEFERIYNLYWSYVYKYEVGHEEDFNPNNESYFTHDRDCFKERMFEDGMAIKVNEGY